MTNSDILESCLIFFDEIGLATEHVEDISDCVVPGLSIKDGVLQICEDSLLYPGDLLHEAGHIAVVPKCDRATLNNETIGEREYSEAEEMMAIAWSYAAALHLKLDPTTVFHDDGYKGGGSWIAEAFASGGNIGVPTLMWAGMTDQFPKMTHWMRS
ncbi:MAG: hypothetical protein ABJO36_04950 [Litorimonas sp.]